MIDRLQAWFAGAPGWMAAAVVIGVAVAVAIAVEAVVRRVAGRLDAGPLGAVLSVLHLPLGTTVAMVGIYASRQFFVAPLTFTLAASSWSAIVIVWTYAGIRLGRRLIDLRDERTVKFGPVLSNILTFFLVLGAIFSLLAIWRIDITPLLASAGIIGVIVGFAARDTISNFASGVSLYFDRTFAVGDMISLPTGERGTVVDISIRSTTILTRDNVTVTIPNAEFDKKQVTNESAPQRYRRLRLDVTVAYGTDLEAAEAALLAAAESVDVVIDEPPAKVRYREFADSGIVAQLRCYIQDPASLAAAFDRLVRAVDREFEDASIRIPFPQREVSFLEAGNELAVADRRPDDDA